MKYLFMFYLSLIMLFSLAQSQEWVNNWIAKNPKLMSKPDSMVALLSQDFQKAIGTEAPTFSFQRIDDDKVQGLNDFRGKVVLINFWTTRCSGCRYEMPDLGHLQDSLSEKGLQVIFLSPETKEVLIRYFTDHKVSGTKGILKHNQLKQPYQLFAVPSSFVVDRNGVVRDTWIGPLRIDSLAKKILPYIAMKSK